MVSPLKWQQHDLWPALNLKGGCGQVFLSNFKAGKMSNRRKKALQNPWYKKKSGYWLMFWGHACLPRQSMWLWAVRHPFPLNRTTIMGGSALPNQKNTIQHKLICHNYPYPAKTMTLSLASRQKLAKLTKWCMKGSKTLWNSMMGAKEKRRHRNRTH